MEDKILEVASLILDFGKVHRKTLHQDGERSETDTDHTVMVGVLGASIASRLYKDLDIGLITQFALVHDLVEVHAGDTDTLTGVNEDSQRLKEEREVLALKKIEETFGKDFSWIHETIERYERLDTKEARFIKVLDKIMPKLTVVLNNAASINKRHIQRSEVEKTFDLQRGKVKQWANDMPELVDLWEYFVVKELDLIKN
jgi:putative hydrolase of HD superfamily